MSGKYNLNRQKKHLIIPISKSNFIMLNHGGHSKLYYPANSDAIRWFVKHEYHHLNIDEIADLGQKAIRGDRDEFHFKNGTDTKEIGMIAENKGVSINTGRAKYGEDSGKIFFVLKLGKKKVL